MLEFETASAFDDLVAVVESVTLQASVSIDELYEEYSAISQHLLQSFTDDDVSGDAKWAVVFQKVGTDNLPNLLKISRIPHEHTCFICCS